MDELIARANELITLLERLENQGKKEILPRSLVTDGRRLILEQLAIIFPPLPPP